jgi:putative hemolysin
MIGAVLGILFFVALLIGINGLYVMGEFATVSARRTRIIQMAEGGNRLARMVLPVLEDRHKLDNYIAASQVGITISSIVLGIYGEQQIAPRLEPWLDRLLPGQGVPGVGLTAILVLALLTTLQVVMGELLPKSLAIQYPEKLALLTAVPMSWSANYILRPLILLLNGSGSLILKLLRVTYGGEHAHVHSPEEIVLLVKESHRGGLLDLDERRMLGNLFQSTRKRAVEIAVPRTRIVAAEVDQPLSEVLRLAADSAYTRIPIYEGDIDNIIGFVHLREMFNLYQTDEGADLRRILRPVPFVPETLRSAEVWNRLNETQSYLAIVFDEYGGTTGLITREDLIEELFGELQDEFDRERTLIRSVGDKRLVLRGDMLISNLNDLLDLDLPHEASLTVGGLVEEELGRIPDEGDSIELQGVRLRVEAVANNSVTSLSLTLPPDKAALFAEEMF